MGYAHLHIGGTHPKLNAVAIPHGVCPPRVVVGEDASTNPTEVAVADDDLPQTFARERAKDELRINRPPAYDETRARGKVWKGSTRDACFLVVRQETNVRTRVSANRW